MTSAATVALGEVALVNTALPAQPSDTSLVSFVPLASLDAVTAIAHADSTRPYEEVSKGYTPFMDRDILVAKITPSFQNCKIGQAQLDHEIGVGSTEFHVVRPTEQLDARYILHFLRQEWVLAAGESRMTGSGGQRRVPASFIRDLQIPLPSLGEQRRIAGILDAADGLRAKRRESITLLDTLTQSIFQDMFGNPEPAWQQRVVNDVAADHRGSIRTGPFGSQLLHSEFVSSGVAVLGIDNAVANEFRWAERRFITEDKYQQLRRYRVHPGDVLITIMGTTGRCAVVPNDIPLAINTKHLCCITLDRQKCLPEYLHAYFLHHRDAREYLGRQGKGAIMVGLNMGLIKAMPVTLPPIDLQAQFVNRISAAREAREAAVQAANQSDGLFASLQAHAFRGQL